MIGNSGLQMLEGNCGSDARSVYDLVKLLSRARSAKNDYTQKPWNTNSDELKLFSNIEPLHKGSEYQDPSFAIGSPSGQGGHLLKGNQFTKKSKRSGLNRRGSITQRFQSITAEDGWNRSNKTPTPEAVPSGHNDSPSSPSTSLRSSVRDTLDRLSNPIAMVKQRLRGAAYFNGRRDFVKLFKYYDRDNSGNICNLEFISLMRRDGRVSKLKMSNTVLNEIFDQVDVDQSGEVSYQEFIDWVQKDAASTFQTKTTKQTFATKETFDRLSNRKSFTGVSRNMHETLVTENESTSSKMENEQLCSSVNVAQARTGMYHDAVSARLVNSLREKSRVSGKKPLVHFSKEAKKAIQTPTRALGRSSDKEYEAMIDIDTKHSQDDALRQSISAASAAGSSGYGRVSPLAYASPVQRRFSLVQGSVIPTTDVKRKQHNKKTNKETKTKDGFRFDTAMVEKKQLQLERTKSRRTNTRTRLTSPTRVVKAKIKAAAYDCGGLNFPKLFRYYDRDNSGLINVKEFISLMRRDAKLTPNQMDDDQLASIFQCSVDADDSGEVSFNEFVEWVQRDQEEEILKKKKKKSSTAIFWSSSSTGYGVINPKKLSSPAQRRFSITQGFVVPDTDKLTVSGKNLKTSPVKKIKKKTSPERRHERRRSITRINLTNPSSIIKQKLKAAAYGPGGCNFVKLLRSYDRDNSGMIDVQEFVGLLRKEAKITTKMMSKAKLERIFKKKVDVNQHGTISHQEFITWINGELKEMVPPAPSAVAAAVALPLPPENLRDRSSTVDLLFEDSK